MGTRNKIVYGSRTFAQADIPSGNCYLVSSLLSDSLEINTIEFEVESTDRTLTSFVRNTPLTYSYDDEQIGIFYVQKVDRVGPTRYKFYATSAIGLLDETTHYGGIYTGQTAAEVIASICGKVPYSIKTKYQKTKLYGWLPIATSRENLSQVLFAVGATVKTDLEGILRIEGLWDGISGTVDQDRMYAGASVEYSAAVTAVSVTEHQYIKGGESAKLFEGVTQSGDLITFDEPVYNLSATGFSILESNANYAKVSAGSGTLTGLKYAHNTREITKPVAAAGTPNVVTVKDATLVSLTNSEAVADRLVNYYKHLEVIDTDAVYRAERPGDRLSMWHPYNEEAVASCLKSVDINISNKLRVGEKSLVGFVPLKYEEAEFLENRVVLTGSGNWTVPEGVSSVRAVLIGGGTGGQGGYNGENGGASKVIVSVSEGLKGGSWSDSPKDPGGGGKAGAASIGGKIYQSTVSVVPGELITYSCGPGGAGGGSNGGAGSAGGDTIFGGSSSAQGASSEAGYTDPVTNEKYAQRGVSGVAGAAGGRGGSAGQGGYKGEDVPPYVGGDGAGPNKFTGSQGGGDLESQTTQTNGGGGGGGAAKGVNGKAPTAAKTMGGGNGANAAAPNNATGYGTGGNGGNGGGGGGSTGGMSWSCTPGYASCWIAPNGGGGGSGSRGSSGAPGCIILYYSVIKTEPSGPVVTKDVRYLLDAKGRRIVV